MFSHIMLGTNDLQKAIHFYDAVLSPLGLERTDKPRPDADYAKWQAPGTTSPIFYVCHPQDGERAQQGNGTMIAFNATNPAMVDTAYVGGMKAGGSCEGEPGERPHYGAGYYGAYIRDPDGNKVHITHRGDL
ncbi:MAG: VOC family protein [Cohaesibacteraceae bacterium]|nr:VOC family protein [Cohaesibacteraceae bacterium]